MGYRDELEAAQARAQSLEAQLGAAQERLAALEADNERLRALARQRGSARAEPPPRPPPEARSRTFGAIHFHPPRTYLPFMRLFLAGVEAAWVRRPRSKRPHADDVWRWVVYYALALPFTYALRLPLYAASMCIGLPYAAMVSSALTLLTLPLIFLSRFSFSAAPPKDESGWWHGEPKTESGAIYLWVLFSFPLSLLLPLTTSLLVDPND